ncbi:MAG: DUF169 domain-containing protein [Candidatus Bathyarchaeia archaeon]
MSQVEEYCSRIVELIRLRTFPLAIKLITNDEIPEGSIRPLKDLGYHLAMCQAFAIARREGKVIVMMKQDNWCFEPVIGLGIAEAPQLFLEGYNRYPNDVMTKEAGEYWARYEFPRLKPGSCSGIIISPLNKVSKAKITPDVVLMYVDPAQLTILALAAAYKNGKDISCKISSHAACVYSTVPVLKDNEPKVALPCLGDRQNAYAQDYELIFSIPYRFLSDLVNGIEFLAKSGRIIPFPARVRLEYEQRKEYKVLGRLVGLDIPE